MLYGNYGKAAERDATHSSASTAYGKRNLNDGYP